MSSVNNNTPATGTNQIGTGGNAGSSDTGTANRALNSNFQDFLKLLTTQLKNQDPTAPADTNQITQEIASLSQVEQQINTNSNLQQLISLFNNTQINNAVSFIGKNVTATGNQAQLVGGTAGISYSLPAGATKATVTVTDSSGNTIFTGSGTTIAGVNQVTWDGTNSSTGAKMADGIYNFKVKATDANGKDVTATTLIQGAVTAVNTQNGATSLAIGSLNVPITSLQSITNPAPSA